LSPESEQARDAFGVFPSTEQEAFDDPEQTPAPVHGKIIISGIFRGTELYAVCVAGKLDRVLKMESSNHRRHL